MLENGKLRKELLANAMRCYSQTNIYFILEFQLAWGCDMITSSHFGYLKIQERLLELKINYLSGTANYFVSTQQIANHLYTALEQLVIPH